MQILPTVNPPKNPSNSWPFWVWQIFPFTESVGVNLESSKLHDTIYLSSTPRDGRVHPHGSKLEIEDLEVSKIEDDRLRKYASKIEDPIGREYTLMVLNKGQHDGFGHGFYCKRIRCPSDRAYVDYVLDEDGVLIDMLLTCVLCSYEWVDGRVRRGGEGEGTTETDDGLNRL